MSLLRNLLELGGELVHALSVALSPPAREVPTPPARTLHLPLGPAIDVLIVHPDDEAAVRAQLGNMIAAQIVEVHPSRRVPPGTACVWRAHPFDLRTAGLTRG